MATVERLRADIEALKARAGSVGDVPADRAEFAESLGISPDPWQGELLRSESPRVLMNCSRQSGKSTLAAVLALHRALTVPDSLVLCLAPALRQSQELFTKLSGFYRALSNPIPPQADRRLSLELANGSRVVTLPGSERTVRGFSGASLLLVDEAARVEDTLYLAVRPMIAVSGGDLVLMSTPFGKRGIFYEEWTGTAPWQRYEVPASQVPRIPASFLEEERAALGPWYAQEYECRFIEASDQVFAGEDIEAALSEEVSPLFSGLGKPFDSPGASHG